MDHSAAAPLPSSLPVTMEERLAQMERKHGVQEERLDQLEEDKARGLTKEKEYEERIRELQEQLQRQQEKEPPKKKRRGANLPTAKAAEEGWDDFLAEGRDEFPHVQACVRVLLGQVAKDANLTTAQFADPSVRKMVADKLSDAEDALAPIFAYHGCGRDNFDPLMRAVAGSSLKIESSPTSTPESKVGVVFRALVKHVEAQACRLYAADSLIFESRKAMNAGVAWVFEGDHVARALRDFLPALSEANKVKPKQITFSFNLSLADLHRKVNIPLAKELDIDLSLVPRSAEVEELVKKGIRVAVETIRLSAADTDRATFPGMLKNLVKALETTMARERAALQKTAAARELASKLGRALPEEVGEGAAAAVPGAVPPASARDRSGSDDASSDGEGAEEEDDDAVTLGKARSDAEEEEGDAAPDKMEITVAEEAEEEDAPRPAGEVLLAEGQHKQRAPPTPVLPSVATGVEAGAEEVGALPGIAGAEETQEPAGDAKLHDDRSEAEQRSTSQSPSPPMAEVTENATEEAPGAASAHGDSCADRDKVEDALGRWQRDVPLCPKRRFRSLLLQTIEEGDGEGDTNVAILDAAREALASFNYKDGAGRGDTGVALTEKTFDDFVHGAFKHGIQRAEDMGEKAFAAAGARMRNAPTRNNARNKFQFVVLTLMDKVVTKADVDGYKIVASAPRLNVKQAIESCRDTLLKKAAPSAV
jgi:hypothetical protein